VNRIRIFRQLRAVEAYRATGVIQHWSVRYNGANVQGRPENGHIALKSDDNSLHIYFAQDSMRMGRAMHELVNRLATFCGFRSATNTELDRRYILRSILDESHQDEIEEMLDREMVPPLASDDELADEEERRNRQNGEGTATLATGRVRQAGSGGAGSAQAVLFVGVLFQNLRVFNGENWNPSQTNTGAENQRRRTSAIGAVGANTAGGRLFVYATQRLSLHESEQRTAWEGEIHVC